MNSDANIAGHLSIGPIVNDRKPYRFCRDFLPVSGGSRL